MKFDFKKKYGQNFLNNKNVIDNIVNSISPDEDDLIIEIGPGAGALTRELKKYKANLLAIEIDEDTKNFLLPLEDDKTKILYTDFLNTNLREIIGDYQFNKLYIIGNLPYYITTPIIEKIIESNVDVESVTIMIQKEVADRFAAKVGSREYGSITVYLNYFFNIEKVCFVGKKNFFPVPNVDSEVIKLGKKEKKVVNNFEFFNKLVKNSFQFKRKNLRNNLKGYDLEKIENILKKYDLTLMNRAEELSFEIFVDIANNY